MITKSKPAHSLSLPQSVKPDGRVYNYNRYDVGENTIKYSEGPKTRDGHCIWKSCEHRFGDQFKSGALALQRNYRGDVGRFYANPPLRASYPDLSGLSMPSVSSVYSDIWNQLDLNCHNSVLLYSGILQAIPLLGGCFRFVSIMNKLGKKITKGMRKQPFTTVLKSAISLDFIDRFVVSPTIDDARMFINAHNYVLNVMNTAYERSGQLPVRYHMSQKDVRSKTSETYSFVDTWGAGFRRVYFNGRETLEAGYRTDVYVLASAAYNTAAIDPLKLWATRCGVLNPLDSAWDLLPFSFVVDYFSRAGEFISGAGARFTDQDALRGRLQKVYGSWYTQSTFQRDLFIAGSATTYSSESPIISFTPGTASAERGLFVRAPFNQLTESESPDGFFRFDLSSTRMRTLGELLIQAKLR